MSSARASFGNTLNDYRQLNTVPAFLGIAFAMMSVYAFGGVPELHFNWVNYTMTSEHATVGSLAIFALAFASSETRDFSSYEKWEQGLIAMAPIAIIGNEYTTTVSDFVATNDPVAGVSLFAITLIAWGVAIR